MLRTLWIEDEMHLLQRKRDWLCKRIDELCKVCQTQGGLVLSIHKMDALKRLKEEEYDLVILDAMLPDDEELAKAQVINRDAGKEILETWLKESEVENWKTKFGVALVLYSAIANKENRDALESVAASAHHRCYASLHKPFDSKDFRNCMNEILDMLIGV